jgi:peroxiredoxin
MFVKKYMGVIGLVFVILLYWSGSSEKPIAHDQMGRAIETSSLKGKWIILNYWAAWCEPCAAEIPELNAFYQAHYKQDALVFGISFDPMDTKALKDYATTHQIAYPLLTTNIGPHFGINQKVDAVPSTFIISPEGAVVKQLSGPQTKSTLEKLMIE